MRCYRCYLLILLFCYLLSYQTAAINSFLEHNISYPTKQNFTFSLLEARTTDDKGDLTRSSTIDTAKKWKTKTLFTPTCKACVKVV